MSVVEKFRKDYAPYPFKLHQVKLHFEFIDQYCLVKSELEFSKQSGPDIAPENTLFLNGENLKLLAISLDGVNLSPTSYQLSDEGLTIDDVPNQFTLAMTTEIYPAKNTTLNGLYQSNHKYCTQCEAEGFRRITYFPDRPDVLTRYEVTIEAEQEGYPYLLSNGELQSQETLPDGRHRAIWSDPHPKPSYLFALVAGDFDLLEDHFETKSGQTVGLQIFVDKGKLSQCDHAMESLKKSMLWDEQTYGLEYDLNRYMIVAVGDFNMGAMENKGLNVFNTAYVLANNQTATDTDFAGVEAVIGHEYFHNWTGNRVTCQDWFQLSLKEGLTVFREQQFSADMNSAAIQRIDDVKTLRAFQFPEDAGPMAHPIRPDSYIEMNNFYTHTVYIKGAEVIRMLETILGQETFNQGVRHYLKKHDGQAATCEDFVVAMEEVSGKDLAQFRYWYSQSGTPELELQGRYLANEGQFVLKISQSCPPTPGQSLKENFYIPLRMALIDASGNAVKLATIEEMTDADIVLSESGDEAVIMISASHHRLVFENIDSEVIPSLLRGFSAPVKLSYPYDQQQRLHLISHDQDPYARWQANQELLQSVVERCLREVEQSHLLDGSAIAELISSRQAILADQTMDPAFKALQLELPSLTLVMENYRPIPIAQLIHIWPMIKYQLAVALFAPLSELTQQCEDALSASDLTQQDAAKWRRLLTTALHMLAASKEQGVFEQAKRLYHAHESMTIKQQTLQLMHHYFTEQSEEILAEFYDDWQDEDLVLDKWFSIQSCNPSDTTYDQVLGLLQHPDFALTNPNKVRALLGRFAQANPAQFHHESGRGYQLISKYIVKLNKTNPQIASRLCSAFNGWRNIDCEQRQEQMQSALKQILATDNLSADVFEIANKALILSAKP